MKARPADRNFGRERSAAGLHASRDSLYRTARGERQHRAGVIPLELLPRRCPVCRDDTHRQNPHSNQKTQTLLKMGRDWPVKSAWGKRRASRAATFAGPRMPFPDRCPHESVTSFWVADVVFLGTDQPREPDLGTRLASLIRRRLGNPRVDPCFRWLSSIDMSSSETPGKFISCLHPVP